ncbi:uncharacterized protein LOC141528250 isoform X2 [Cotesia typhae]|uniref:uncharacterized protein LOC141528250 isoform X2 n=1 Tax=Cotesia typhae TaxID=2053667 RepID=UPI003D69B29E
MNNDDPGAFRINFMWTEELRVDLLVCYQRSELGVSGYMARMHTLWSNMHPELAHFTHKHLRNYAAHLRRNRISLVPDRRQSNRLSFLAQLHQERRRSYLENNNPFAGRRESIMVHVKKLKRP